MNELFSFFSGLGGILSLFGWFFCLGQLIIRRLAPNLENGPFILGVSCAMTAVGLIAITPWIALPYPILLFGGLMIFAYWAAHKPTLPKISFFSNRNLAFGVTLGAILIYGIVFLVFPDVGFDSLSYHIPFIHTFSAQGQIPLPANPQNWVDHINFTNPKVIETIFGLANMLIGSYAWLQFLMVIAAALMLNRIAQRIGVRDPWIASALFLTSGVVVFSMVHATKNFYVEAGILLFFTCSLFVILNRNKISQGDCFIAAMLSAAIAGSKINAIVYVASTALIAAYFSGQWTMAAWMIGGGIVGIGASLLPAIANGISIENELKIAQAFYHGATTPFLERLTILLESTRRFIPSGAVALGIILAPILFIIDRKSRALVGVAIGGFVALFLALLFTNLYFLTYLQFTAYYAGGFIGIGVILLGLFLQRLSDNSRLHLKTLSAIMLTIILVGGLIGSVAAIKLYKNDYFVSGKYYQDMISSIPDKPSTRILFMNNINPITAGFEHSTVLDFTSFPPLQGDPCTFWRENKITHVIFWRILSTSYQLDGGDPSFYKEAKSALLSNRCTRLLSTNPNPASPLIGEVKYE